MTCPLWDDDGRVYLAHAWAGSRAKFNSVLTVCEMNKEGTAVISDPVLVFDGNDGVIIPLRELSFISGMDFTICLHLRVESFPDGNW